MSEIHRGDILKEAHDLTTQDRNKQYGPPEVNLNLAGDLKKLFWSQATRQFSPAEHEAIDMVLTKLSRIGTGTYKKDNYVDGAAYIAIAGQMGSLALLESGIMAEPKPLPHRILTYAGTHVQVPEDMEYSIFEYEMFLIKNYHRGPTAIWEQIPQEEILKYAAKVRHNWAMREMETLKPTEDDRS